MLRDFERWPRYKQKYIKAFDRMIANHPGEIKVASGELAPSNAGDSNIHRMAPVEHLTENPSTGATNQVRGSLAHKPVADERRRKPQMVGGEQLLIWWLWMLREPTDRGEKNPLE